MTAPTDTMPLHHPTRAELKRRIDTAERPVAVADLARALNLPLARASYHVGVLAASEIVDLRDGQASSNGAGQSG